MESLWAKDEREELWVCSCADAPDWADGWQVCWLAEWRQVWSNGPGSGRKGRAFSSNASFMPVFFWPCPLSVWNSMSAVSVKQALCTKGAEFSCTLAACWIQCLLLTQPHNKPLVDAWKMFMYLKAEVIRATSVLKPSLKSSACAIMGHTQWRSFNQALILSAQSLQQVVVTNFLFGSDVWFVVPSPAILVVPFIILPFEQHQLFGPTWLWTLTLSQGWPRSNPLL